MEWQDLIVNGKSYSMARLQPFVRVYAIAGEQVTVRFEFGLHCFTDDKGSGEQIHHKGEIRYFSLDRYECSQQLNNYIDRRFFEGCAVPHNSKKGGRRYFCLDLHDYAIFFSISKPQGTTNRLRIFVISAYEVEQWGRHSLPKGRPFNVRYILEKRNKGESV
ncbi:hypothetical protein [Pseudomonas sp. 3A(2025)]